MKRSLPAAVRRSLRAVEQRASPRPTGRSERRRRGRTVPEVEVVETDCLLGREEVGRGEGGRSWQIRGDGEEGWWWREGVGMHRVVTEGSGSERSGCCGRSEEDGGGGRLQRAVLIVRAQAQGSEEGVVRTRSRGSSRRGVEILLRKRSLVSSKGREREWFEGRGRHELVGCGFG